MTNFVIFAPDVDYFTLMMLDILKLSNVQYISNIPRDMGFSPLKRELYELHNNQYLNHFFPLPFKDLWYKRMYSVDKYPNTPRCFIFFMDYLKPWNERFFRYLNSIYPNSKLVIYFEDIVASRNTKHGNALALGLIDKYFDLAVTYDKGDALKYGFDYYPTFMSKIELNNELIPIYDFLFLGADKGRLEILEKIYKVLSSKGYRCKFSVSQVAEYKKNEDIEILKKNISYRDYLSLISQSKCIVEVVQNNATGYTLRTWESLLYQKKMITNNKSLKETEYFNTDHFFCFDTIADLDDIDRFMQEKIRLRTFDISPFRFLEYIEQKLHLDI